MLRMNHHRRFFFGATWTYKKKRQQRQEKFPDCFHGSMRNSRIYVLVDGVWGAVFRIFQNYTFHNLLLSIFLGYLKACMHRSTLPESARQGLCLSWFFRRRVF